MQSTMGAPLDVSRTTPCRPEHMTRACQPSEGSIPVTESRNQCRGIHTRYSANHSCGVLEPFSTCFCRSYGLSRACHAYLLLCTCACCPRASASGWLRAHQAPVQLIRQREQCQRDPGDTNRRVTFNDGGSEHTRRCTAAARRVSRRSLPLTLTYRDPAAGGSREHKDAGA